MNVATMRADYQLKFLAATTHVALVAAMILKT